MPNQVVPYESKPLVERRPLTEVANIILADIERPGLSDAAGGFPRTILIGRMLAGAADSDLLLSTLLCLPKKEMPHLALVGEPSGPAFKTRAEELKVRYEADDPDMVGRFLDWRLQAADSTVFASFDPSCARALLSTMDLLKGRFAIPIDVIFLAARNEDRPGLLNHMEAKARVIRTQVAGLSLRSSCELEIPAIPKLLEGPYRSNFGMLREIASGMPPGSRAQFASEIFRFSAGLEAELAQ